jgi:glucosamine 6-phosphate synthetase-like amidotransferase/phosphosugar isomerase protein
VELRQQFIAEGLRVRSQNDGETCVHAVEHYINNGYDFIDSIRLAYDDLAGYARRQPTAQEEEFSSIFR